MMQVATSQSSQSETNLIRIKTAIERLNFSAFEKQSAAILDRSRVLRPTRQQISEENYRRRYVQMSSMGFQTPMNVPYKPIGETYDILNTNADQSSFDKKVNKSL